MNFVDNCTVMLSVKTLLSDNREKKNLKSLVYTLQIDIAFSELRHTIMDFWIFIL